MSISESPEGTPEESTTKLRMPDRSAGTENSKAPGDSDAAAVSQETVFDARAVSVNYGEKRAL